jgi:hypothetical protein
MPTEQGAADLSTGKSRPENRISLVLLENLDQPRNVLRAVLQVGVINNGNVTCRKLVSG